MSREDVLVVGGGLIGLCSAYSLLRAGHRVTIIDRDGIGAGAARGNAGEITPLNVLPLAAPGMMREVARGVLSDRHYLSIAPTALPGLLPFGLSFLSRCRSRRVAEGTRALDQLSRGVFAAFDSYAADGIALRGGGRGFLYTHADIERLSAFRAALIERATTLGLEGPEELVRGDDVRRLEPALHDSVRAAFVAPSERYLDPGAFVDELHSRLRSGGAEIRTGVEAARIDRSARTPAAILGSETGEERLTASRIVLAGGAWTGALLARSGVRVPHRLRIVPGRGYSFTLGTTTLPGLLLGSLDQRTVAIPMSGRLRVVGLMDFDGSTDRFDPARLEGLAARAARFLGDVDPSDIAEAWVGPRPMTPSGLPVIAPIPGDERIVVAAGHNMHGLSLGPVTGELVTALVEGRRGEIAGAAVDLAPFGL